MREGLKLRELIIGSEYSPWGYLLEAMKDFWKYDGLMVISSRKRADVADVVISLIKLMGYEEKDKTSNYEEKKKVYKCKSCGKIYKTIPDKCKLCHISDFKEIDILNHVTILEKVGMMRIYQAELISQNGISTSLDYLAKQKDIECLKDIITKKRWG